MTHKTGNHLEKYAIYGGKIYIHLPESNNHPFFRYPYG